MRLLAMVIIMIPSVALAQQTPAKPPTKLTLYRTIDSAACSGDATVWVDSEAHVPGLSDVNLLGYGESIVNLDTKIARRALDLGVSQ